MIYLDNAATTFPKPECVYQAAEKTARKGAVNAGRGAYRAARDLTEKIKTVKQGLLSLCDARGQAEVALMPSVTVALNQVIQGQRWQQGQRVYLSPYEHNAVLRPMHLMQQRYGLEIRELPLRQDLSIDLVKMRRAFAKEPPDFVAVTAVSNVTGYVLPAEEILGEAKRYGAFTLLDAAQAMGLVKMRFARLRADAVAFAGHKTLYAPFGIAGLMIRNGVDLEPFLVGGNGIRSEDPEMPPTMPEKLECASMDPVAIAGLEASLEWLKHADIWEHERKLTAYLLEHLMQREDCRVYCAPEGADQAGIISFNLRGFRANDVAAILDREHDIAVRAGHHCAGRIHRHLKNRKADGCIRVSLGAFNTKQDVDALLQALDQMDKEILKKIDQNILRGNC